jgi:hypothetical protein
VCALHHLSEPEIAIAETARVLRCGPIPDAVQTLEVGIFGPQLGIMGMDGNEYDAVGKRQFGLGPAAAPPQLS